jgi:hypothetical protein
MTRSMRLSSWPAAALLLVAGCAPQNDFSSIATAPIAMVCDGGRTFTIAYADNFDNAVVETEGQRLELPRIPTASTMTPTWPEDESTSWMVLGDEIERSGIGGRDDFARRRGAVGGAGTTGVRYGNDEALFISRNQGAVLQVGDDTYSNCQVART